MGRLLGCKIVRHAHVVSHLFFADDSFLFYRANLDKANHLKDLLKQYKIAFGQAVNVSKSALYFSKNRVIDLHAQICGEMQITEEEAKFVYLRVSVGVKRKKKDVFAYNKDRIWQRIQTWKGRALSKAGKELLVKCVCQSIPNYVMGLCLLLEELLHSIEKMLNKFWWSNKGGLGGMKWMKWYSLCQRNRMEAWVLGI